VEAHALQPAADHPLTTGISRTPGSDSAGGGENRTRAVKWSDSRANPGGSVEIVSMKCGGSKLKRDHEKEMIASGKQGNDRLQTSMRESDALFVTVCPIKN
jgi:hypothetical protein